MKSRAELTVLPFAAFFLIAAVPQGVPQVDPGRAESPADAAQPAAQEARYDEVGHAAGFSGEAPERLTVYAAHATLAEGSFVEVTAIDTGRTILVVIARKEALSPGTLIALSPGAASQLGLELTPTAPVRVRAVQPSPQEEVALTSGGPAPSRLDAPPALLKGLRARLSPPVTLEAAIPVPPPPPAVAEPRAPKPTPPRAGNFVVQVATLSNAANAKSLAARLGGFTEGAGAFTRVRMGPFPDRAAAEAARSRAVAAGYRDAAVIRLN